MLLPSVLPCENAFRISRSRTTTRSQTQRNNHSHNHHHSALCNSLDCNDNMHDISCRANTAANNFVQAIGLGLSITKPVTRTNTNNSCKALHQILSLDTTPRGCLPAPTRNKNGPVMMGRYPMGPATPSDSDEPQTPEQQKIPRHGMWTTPLHDVHEESSADSMDSVDEDQEKTPKANNHYTYTIVTRNNKRRRNGEAVNNNVTSTSGMASNDNMILSPSVANRFVTPDPMTTPTQPPDLLPPRTNSMPMDTDTEDEDLLLLDPFLTPKRARVRGPSSKRIAHTRRNLGPWTREEDSQLVTMILSKINTQLKSRDWAECANTLGRDGESVGERWKNLVEDGEVGLVCEQEKIRRKKEREREERRERMCGSGRGRLQPLRRAKEKARERNRRLSLGGRACRR